MTKLTESIIRAGASGKVFERGQSLYESGAVFDTAVQDNFLFGSCEGTEMPFYRVKVELDEHGIRTDYCNCPYDFGGYCKHTVAVLLTYVHDSARFTVRRSPKELLASQTKEQIAALIDKLLQEKPELYEWFESKIAVQNVASEKSKPEKHRKIDIEPHRRRVRNILHSLDGMRASEAYWYVGGLANQLDEVEDTANEFLKAGEAEAACEILLTLFEEGYNCFDYIDDSNGEMGDFFDSAAKILAEALLSLETDAQRKQFVSRIKELHRYLSDYGVEGLEIAIFAAENGWGNLTPSNFEDDEVDDDEDWDEDGEDWNDEGDYYDDADYFNAFTEIKLNILERQERTDEFLKLALETRRFLRYARKLGELGQIEKAVEYALQNFTSPTDALELAKVLREANHFEESLQVAEKGLSLEGGKAALGEWLAPIEESLGRTELALEAWTKFFVEKPALTVYQKIQALSAENWQKVQPRLMAAMEKNYNQVPLAEVLLLEERWDEAVKLGEKNNNVYWGAVTNLIADGLIKHRPEWVIKIGTKNFDELVKETKSKYYPSAVKWLKKAKLAYAELGKTDEWNKYLANVKEIFKRRPALQSELKSL